MIRDYGGERKQQALQAASRLQQAGPALGAAGAQVGARDPGHAQAPSGGGAGPQQGPKVSRSSVRNDVYELVSELKQVAKNQQASATVKSEPTKIRKALSTTVEYAPYGCGC